jgi:prepilin-type N-terminal cleavage/methylation domain-containing protein
MSAIPARAKRGPSCSTGFTLILRQAQDQVKDRRSFTLIELLVVIAVVAILSVVVILVLNPAELLKQARDSNRLQDLANLNTALNLFQTDTGGNVSMGSASTTYVSIPDPAATSTAGDQCQGLGLPSLPSGFSYHCAASSTYRLVNGTGWIPVDLTAISFKSPLALLPVDPVNTTSSRNYYTYTPGGSWELAVPFEAARNKLGGASNRASQDGGPYPDLYELGTNLTLLPVDYGDTSLVGYWTFEEGGGASTADRSGNGNTGTWSGTGSHWAAGKVGGYAGQFNGTDDGVSIPNSTSLQSLTAVTMTAWFKLYSTPVGEWSAFMMKGSYGYGGYGFLLLENYHLNIYIPGIGVISFDSNPSFSLNTWYYLVGTADASNRKIYINGSLVASGAGGSVSPGSQTFLLGTDGNYRLSGLLDDVRIYNRALSAAEIAAMYNATK